MTALVEEHAARRAPPSASWCVLISTSTFFFNQCAAYFQDNRIASSSFHKISVYHSPVQPGAWMDWISQVEGEQ